MTIYYLFALFEAVSYHFTRFEKFEHFKIMFVLLIEHFIFANLLE